MRQRDGVDCAHASNCCKPCAQQEETRIPIGLQPTDRFSRELALQPDIGAILIQPLMQARPFAQQGFVGHFQSRTARLQIVIESEQARLAESIDD